MSALALHPDYGPFWAKAWLEHQSALTAAISENKITARDPFTMLPGKFSLPGDVVTVPDLARYVASFGLTVRSEDVSDLTPIERAHRRLQFARKRVGERTPDDVGDTAGRKRNDISTRNWPRSCWD